MIDCTHIIEICKVEKKFVDFLPELKDLLLRRSNNDNHMLSLQDG